MEKEARNNQDFFDEVMIGVVKELAGAIASEDEHGIIHNVPADIAEIATTYAKTALSERNKIQLNQSSDDFREEYYLKGWIACENTMIPGAKLEGAKAEREQIAKLAEQTSRESFAQLIREQGVMSL